MNRKDPTSPGASSDWSWAKAATYHSCIRRDRYLTHKSKPRSLRSCSAARAGGIFVLAGGLGPSCASPAVCRPVGQACFSFRFDGAPNDGSSTFVSIIVTSAYSRTSSKSSAAPAWTTARHSAATHTWNTLALESKSPSAAPSLSEDRT